MEWSSTHPATSVAAVLRPSGGNPESRITLHTTVRTGDRIAANGFVVGVATDARTLAASAVWKFVVDRPRHDGSPKEHAEAAERAGAEAAANLALWTAHPLLVDGTEYALRVHTFPDGFAAIADLGPEVLTIVGDILPERLTLTRRQARGDRLVEP